MKTKYTAWAAAAASLLVAACGGGGSDSATGTQNSNPGRGELMQSPPLRVTSLTAADYNARLNGSTTGQGLLTLSTGSPTGSVPCGIDVQYLKYGTVGANGEATTASAVLMVPTGTAARCTGARPIVLHAHGTAVEQRYNMADFTDSTNPGYNESQVIAAMYASQGYIVVAPNYAGYDISNLGYHPFLVASQQTKDMLDALTAAKAALPTLLTPTTASGKIYVSGYSQGGYVALATHKAMVTDPATVTKLASLGLTIRGSAPMSGPYALKNFGDQIVGGAVNAGSTQLLPMLLTGYQKSYGNVYTSTGDLYESAYVTGIESNFPGPLSSSNLVANGKVPQLALFATGSLPAAPTGQPLSPLWSLGFGTPNLIKSSFRTAYLTDAATNNANPQNGLRIGLKTNDLTVNMPSPVGATLLCGGGNDPTVYYSTNTSALKSSWTTNAPSTTAAAVTEVNMDLNSSGAVSNPAFSSLQTAFTSANPTSSATFASTYHSALVPFCVRAARGFFDLVN